MSSLLVRRLQKGGGKERKRSRGQSTLHFAVPLFQMQTLLAGVSLSTVADTSHLLAQVSDPVGRRLHHQGTARIRSVCFPSFSLRTNIKQTFDKRSCLPGLTICGIRRRDVWENFSFGLSLMLSVPMILKTIFSKQLAADCSTEFRLALWEPISLRRLSRCLEECLCAVH